jgi:hypothetical protein
MQISNSVALGRNNNSKTITTNRQYNQKVTFKANPSKYVSKTAGGVCADKGI